MKVGIVGLGLIGGSLGLDLRQRGLKVLGVSRQSQTCQKALERGVVDEASQELSLLQSAEIIFICTPIGLIVPILKALIPHLKTETIVTDVGSVKMPIVSQCSPLWPNFVGGHPMAGTAEQGIDGAQQDLFVGRSYVLTPTEDTPLLAWRKVEEIARSLGSVVEICPPDVHDSAVAWISHLPVMISASLIDACMSEPESSILQRAQKFASSGFRDTSRVGGGNPELGVMMAQYNKEAVLRSLQQYRYSLDQFIQYIDQENWETLEQLLKSTQQVRHQFLDGSS
ncbi:MAG: prephenate/arogenate dehydrogenase [Microcystaceae cyanobacterium]